MLPTLAFDVYGTLIDTQGVYQLLQHLVGEKAASFIATWRQKQLEYSFRRTAMQQYADFSQCTYDALDFADQRYQTKLSKSQKTELMDSYKQLPPFAEAKEALQMLRAAGYPLYAFSNGSRKALSELLQNAQLIEQLDGYVSVEETQLFKPHPKVYAHFNQQSSSKAHQSWLISGNTFDVIGALNAGMKTAWVQRNHQEPFDSWGAPPTVIIHELTDLKEALEGVLG